MAITLRNTKGSALTHAELDANFTTFQADSGSSLVGFLQDGTGAVARTVQDKGREVVSVKDFGAVGDGSDATAMFNLASAAARRIYIPSGTYLLNAANWPSNTEFIGDGDTTILKMVSASSSLFFADSGSATVSSNIVNLRISNVQLLATCDTDGFSQFKHLVVLNGVSNVVFENVTFKGFRGDGAYLGSGMVPGDERHNENVTFKHCTFDGINRENRNAISFIDIDGALIEGCTFKNCTKSTMPGPIDFEPNSNAFHIIHNVKVKDNTFSGNGGNLGEISVFVPSAVTQAPSKITITGNTSTDYLGTGAMFFFGANRAPTSTSVENAVLFSGNRATVGARPFYVTDGKGIRIINNTFSDFTLTAYLGYTDAANKVIDTIINNSFVRCGSVSGNGLTIYNVEGLKLSGKFDDCGTGVVASANAIVFHTGTSSSVDIDGLEVISPTDKTLVAIQKEAAHTFTASTNRFFNNNIGSLANSFAAEYSDSLETAYTPVVTGSSSAGAGTYTIQYGRWRRIGKVVFFRVKISIDSGHTGTGMIQVGLPTLAIAANNNEETACHAAATGVASTGGQFGLINPAVQPGSLGAVRIYMTQTGTTGQVTIPAGAFTVHVSGFYNAA